MKKIIAIIFATLLLISAPITAFADNYIGAPGGSAEAQVTYHQESNYTIVIPSVIDGNMQYTFHADYMDISESEIVKVYCYAISEGGIPMTNSYGHTFNLTFYGGEDVTCVAKFTRGQTVSPITIYGSPYPGSEPQAGDYTGTVEFYVMIEPNL